MNTVHKRVRRTDEQYDLVDKGGKLVKCVPDTTKPLAEEKPPAKKAEQAE